MPGKLGVEGSKLSREAGVTDVEAVDMVHAAGGRALAAVAKRQLHSGYGPRRGMQGGAYLYT
jgi:hypothetical protein